MPADEAQAQMNPAIACSQTILATCGARRYSLDLIQMGARLRHVFISIVNGKLQLFRRMPPRRGERLIELGKYARGAISRSRCAVVKITSWQAYGPSS